jgi:NAD(P)-dependent dehydrogenase (short-subunit alcohol dehydrogenase family)
MRVVVVGATGTIGSAVVDALALRHDVVRASRSGEPRVDLNEPASIDALFDAVGEVDAVVCTAAGAPLVPTAELTDAAVAAGMRAKLVGQIALATHAQHRVRDGGSITLTSGRFDRPLPGRAVGAAVNAGLEAFVVAAGAELDRGLRLNAVSPGWVGDTPALLGITGVTSVAVEDVARAYVEVVEGSGTGEVISL